MPESPTPERLHADLVSLGVLEDDSPVRFTTRFRGALARAAARLQAEEGGGATAVQAVDRQVRAALDEHLGEKRGAAGPGHVAFVRVVHVESLPEAVRRLLGV